MIEPRLKIGITMLTALLFCFVSMGGTLTVFKLLAPGGALAGAHI